MKIKRSLRPTTIIPDELYVERMADRQLDAIIEDMGRPGYVLVARQMGKTNLLLRMKRKREATGDRVLYIDLSVPFETATDLFRSIVDHLCDELHNESLREKIDHDRFQNKLDGNAEFDRHLRLLLLHHDNDKVIIVLDEIDSLVGHSYSDKILAQIRSMYFARANYSVYEKLTYVLSGVAEPTDLIKDRNISPFNIGEKIYLNDFTIEETLLLVQKAGIVLEDAVVHTVFSWTNGNPRMSWDILSALEELQMQSLPINAGSVDEIVKRLYLTRFDRAPIDHIRTLAESDNQVRNALVTLLYGKGDTLDDKSRSKLYLAGITTAAADETPRIRNRILAHALSEEWLVQVKVGRQGLIEAAERRFNEDDFEGAVQLYDEYLKQGGERSDLSDINLLNIGLAFYSLSNLGEAERAFQDALDRTKVRSIRSVLRFHLALTKILLGNVADCEPLLRSVAGESGEFQLQAQQQLINLLAASSLASNAKNVIDDSEDLIRRLKHEADLNPKTVSELLAASYYNKARAFASLKQFAEAASAIEEMMLAAETDQLPGLSFALFDDDYDWAGREEAFYAISSQILEKGLSYNPSPNTFSFKEGDMLALVSEGISLKAYDRVAALIEHHRGNVGGSTIEAALQLGFTTTKNIRPAIQLRIFDYILHLGKQTGERPDLMLAAARGAIFGSSPSNDSSFSRYYNIILSPESLPYVDEHDVFLVVQRARLLLSEERLSEAASLFRAARPLSQVSHPRAQISFSLLLFQEMQFCQLTFDDNNAKRLAKELLKRTNQNRLPVAGLEADVSGLLERLRATAHAALAHLKPKGPEKVFGRNDLVRVIDVRDGRSFTEKFKRVERRIQSGELRISEE